MVTGNASVVGAAVAEVVAGWVTAGVGAGSAADMGSVSSPVQAAREAVRARGRRYRTMRERRGNIW
jgi:hypothetical protein